MSGWWHLVDISHVALSHSYCTWWKSPYPKPFIPLTLSVLLEKTDSGLGQSSRARFLELVGVLELFRSWKLPEVCTGGMRAACFLASQRVGLRFKANSSSCFSSSSRKCVLFLQRLPNKATRDGGFTPPKDGMPPRCMSTLDSGRQHFLEGESSRTLSSARLFDMAVSSGTDKCWHKSALVHTSQQTDLRGRAPVVQLMHGCPSNQSEERTAVWLRPQPSHFL